METEHRQKTGRPLLIQIAGQLEDQAGQRQQLKPSRARICAPIASYAFLSPSKTESSLEQEVVKHQSLSQDHPQSQMTGTTRLEVSELTQCIS